MTRISIFNFHFSNNKSGFTLIELIIVFSITVILSTVGIAGFLSFTRESSVDNTIKDLKSMLQVAKSKSFSQSKPSQCTDTDQLLGYQVLICSQCNGQGAQCPACQSTNDYELDVACGVGTFLIDSKKLPPGVTFNDKLTTSRQYFFQTLTGGVVFSSGINGSAKITLNGFNTTRIATISAVGTIQ